MAGTVQLAYMFRVFSIYRPDASELLKLQFFKKARVSLRDVHALGLPSLHFTFTVLKLALQMIQHTVGLPPYLKYIFFFVGSMNQFSIVIGYLGKMTQ